MGLICWAGLLLKEPFPETVEFWIILVWPLFDNSEVNMPVYEFKCLDCGNTFTLPLSVRAFEHQEYECPSCKKKNLEEQFTSVSVVTSKKS